MNCLGSSEDEFRGIRESKQTVSTMEPGFLTEPSDAMS